MKIKFGDSSLNLKAGGSLANIDRGPRGYSAYEIAVQEGFVGTEEEWLASLVGPEGKQGKDGERGLEGPRGKEGPEGKQGISGYTPVKGVDYFTEADIESLDIPKKTSDIQNDSGFIDRSVNNLVNYTLKTNTGSLIDLSIDNTNYVVTLKLKNQDGTIISTDTIDLPLESVVVGGSYDKINKKIVLTLENGNKVDIPVGDLIAGLQTEITSANKLASDLVDDTNSGNKFTNMSEKQAWNNKYDKPSSGIPATDLSGQVQTSLGKADTALQEHQDLTDYVKNTDYATSSKGGVVKGSSFYGNAIDAEGHIVGVLKTYSEYSSGSNGLFISKGTLENVITGKGLTTKSYVDGELEDKVDSDAYVQEQEAQDSNIEENASNIDWLQTLVNQMPHVAGQGTDLSLQSVLNYRLMKFLPQGVTKQESTKGYQLLPKATRLNENITDSLTNNGITFTNLGGGHFHIKGTATAQANCSTFNPTLEPLILPIGEYTISAKTLPSGVNIIISGGGNNGFAYTELNSSKLSSTSRVTDDTKGFNYVLIRIASGTTVDTDIYFMLESGPNAHDWEPYTGGISTPNPSYQIMPSRVTGENGLVIENNNLFSYSDNFVSGTNNGITVTKNSDGTYSYVGTATGGAINVWLNGGYGAYVNADISKPILVLDEGTTITTTDIQTYIVYEDLTKTSLDPGTLLLPKKAYIVAYRARTAVNGTTYNEIKHPMLSIGSTAPTTHVEHEEQNYKLSLGNIELNSSPDGTVRDQIVGKPNEWYKREYIGKVVLDGSETWIKRTDGAFQINVDGVVNKTVAVSNYFNYNRTSDSTGAFYTVTDYLRFFYNEMSTVEDFKTWLSTHNTIVWYQKAQYTDILITDTTLITQLNNIYNNAHSYNGVTNITTTYEDGNEQMYLDIEALKNVWEVTE